MANTEPVADDASVIAEVRAAAAARADLADVFPVGAITQGLEGETLAEIGEMVASGVRVFSDDGRCVPTARTLRNALTYARAFDDVVIAEHCEDASLSIGQQMHEGISSYSLGLAGQPSAAEDAIVFRDIEMARLTGGRLHICHLSTARSVDLVRRAKADGLRVTAEVTPHHLAFTDEDLRTYDTNQKVNPPFRSAEDRDALRAGLADGTIDAIATDHAPHAVEEKEAEFDRAPHGTIGLETALAVAMTELVAPGHLDLVRAIEVLSTAPARLLGAREHGGPIEPGRPANLVVFDPEESWTVEPPFVSEVAQQRVHRQGPSPAGSGVRSCTGSSRSRTGRRRGDGSGRTAGPRGRHGLPGLGVRRGGRDVRGGRLQHRDDRLPGGPDRPVLRGQIVTMTATQQGNYGMHADDAESGGCRWPVSPSGRFPVVVQPEADPRSRRRSPPRAWSGSRASTRGS